MSNVTAEVKGNQIVITMPFDPKGTPSKTGKTMVVASTNGNQKVKAKGYDKEISIGCNVYFKPE
jgi:polysaccharide deacetylase 2 family uncharacterized protein YibQ